MRRITPLGLAFIVVMGLVTQPVFAGRKHEVPFVGLVQEASVPVYAGAGRTFYTVGQLQEDALVTVDEVLFGWYKVVPPQGFYSYILAKHVRSEGSDTQGWIRSRRAEVRAASPKGVAKSFRRQLYLLNGAPVRIVAREGRYYKIVPPKGAYIFLPPGSVQPASASEIAKFDRTGRAGDGVGAPRSRAGSGAGDLTDMLRIAPRSSRKRHEVQEAAPEALLMGTPVREPLFADGAGSRLPVSLELPDGAMLGAARPARATPDVSVHDPEGDLTAGRRARAQAVRVAVQKLHELDGVPLEKQQVQELLYVFQTLSEQERLCMGDREIVSAGLRRLRQRAAVLTALHAISLARQNGHRTSGKPGVVVRGEPAPLYDIQGELLASSVYDGTNRPRLFRVVEPRSGRTIAYVVPGPSIRPGVCLGRRVGIIGQVRMDPLLKLRVIGVERLDVIEASQTVASRRG